MVVQHNLSALNANRQLGIVNGQQAKSTEKLSSGYKINRAADNAAGLTISEKMRWQIRGLNRASLNAQDGVSLLNVADGALDETQSIIQRIRELSVQGANDTNTEEDRDAIQEEIDSLLSEVDRIADTTEFNTMKLLDGSLEEESSENISVQNEDGVLMMTQVQASRSASVSNPLVDPSVTSIGGLSADQINSLNAALKDSIVPGAVNAIQSSFGAFSSAVNATPSQVSSQIGYKLYTDNNTSVLAAVRIGWATDSDGRVLDDYISLGLEVNTHSLEFNGNDLTSDSRSELEATILHEMMHAYMDDILTNGMIGATDGYIDRSNRFPSWFVEGAAQTVGGANDWVSSIGLRGNTLDDINAIGNIVRSGGNRLGSEQPASEYATGYLATLYLAYLENGSSSVGAADLRSGLNSIFDKLKNGSTLDDIIRDDTPYDGVRDFQNQFGDTASSTFIQEFLREVNTAAGARGSIISGRTLQSPDLLGDSAVNPLPNVFRIDTSDGSADMLPSTVGSARNWSTGGGGADLSDGSGLWLQVGALGGQGVQISLDDTHADSLGLSSLSVSDFVSAGRAIADCDSALRKISEVRSRIGAYVNRLDHVVQNLDNTSENTQSAESLLRDTDMAQEMVEYSKSNILTQAGQSMLAQATKMTEGVLSLLNG